MSSRSTIRDRYSFANLNETLALPDLIAIQRESFDWFLAHGLADTFRDISPIKDFTETLQLELEFDPDDEDLRPPPKFTVEECKEKDMTFSAPIGDNQDFAGERTVVSAPSVAADYRISRLFFGADVGVRIRPTTEFSGAKVGTQLTTAAGAGAPPLPPRGHPLLATLAGSLLILLLLAAPKEAAAPKYDLAGKLGRARRDDQSHNSCFR